MIKRIVWIVLGLLLVAQLIRPSQKNPAVDPALDFQNTARPPAEVLNLLKAACYDCHSNETRYPWYSQVSPVSWWLANHVNEGREHLNFSEFGKLSAHDRSEALGEAAETIQEGEMPLSSYTWLGMHPEANLSSAQRNLLVTWLKGGSTGVSDDED